MKISCMLACLVSSPQITLLPLRVHTLRDLLKLDMRPASRHCELLKLKELEEEALREVLVQVGRQCIMAVQHAM